MGTGSSVELTGNNFEQEVMQSSLPVLVDFWAAWCGPCKTLAPILEEIAAEYAGKLKVGKVDVDEQQALAAKFGIRGVPTLIVFKGGQIKEQIVGNPGKKELLRRLTPHLE